MGAKATKAVAAQNMLRRADRMMAALDDERVADKVARIKFPSPAPCGRTPLVAKDLTKNYGSLEVFTGVDLAIDRGSRVVVLGLNGAGKTTLLRLLAGVEAPDTGGLEPGHGLKIGYFAQEHDTLDNLATVWENIRHAAPDTGEQESARSVGRVHVQRSAARSAGGHAVRRREDPARPGGSRRFHRERSAARRTDEQSRSGVARAGTRRAAQLSRSGGAGDPRPGCRRGVGPAAGGAAARRHGGLLVGGIRRPHRAWPEAAFAQRLVQSALGGVSALLRWVFVGASQRGGVDEETEQISGSDAARSCGAHTRGARASAHLCASTGRSYGSIHSMLRESGTTMRSRGGPNHRTAPLTTAGAPTLRRGRARAPSFSGSSPDASRATKPSSTRSR